MTVAHTLSGPVKSKTINAAESVIAQGAPECAFLERRRVCDYFVADPRSCADSAHSGGRRSELGAA